MQLRTSPSKRHFRPSGAPLDDGKNLYHVQLRITERTYDQVRQVARDHERPYAHVFGELVELAVSMGLLGNVSRELTSIKHV